MSKGHTQRQRRTTKKQWAKNHKATFGAKSVVQKYMDKESSTRPPKVTESASGRFKRGHDRVFGKKR